MNKTVIMLTIFLIFGFASSNVLAGSGFFAQGGGGGATPPDKPRLTGGGDGVTPPDKPKSLEPKSFCVFDHCLKLD